MGLGLTALMGLGILAAWVFLPMVEYVHAGCNSLAKKRFEVTNLRLGAYTNNVFVQFAPTNVTVTFKAEFDTTLPSGDSASFTCNWSGVVNKGLLHSVVPGYNKEEVSTNFMTTGVKTETFSYDGKDWSNEYNTCQGTVTTNLTVVTVEYDIDHVCTTSVHAAYHNIAVTLTPTSPGTTVDLELRKISGTRGDARFMPSGSTKTNITSSTTLTVMGVQESDAISNMVMDAAIGGTLYASDKFTVVDVKTQEVTEVLHTINTTNDTTQTDDTNTVWVCQTSNDTATVKLSLSWMPPNYPKSEFWWDAILSGGAPATEWGGPATFENNPTNITWTPGNPTNREFRIRTWFDCDKNDTYLNTEPHRIIDVKVVDFVTLMLTNNVCSNSVIDEARTDEPPGTNNVLYVCEGTNGTAQMSIQGWWLPDNVNSNWFRWRITLTNDTESDTTQWLVDSKGTFATNPVTVTWTNALDTNGQTNRAFKVRGWYDCNRNDQYDADEPHRLLYVYVLKVDLVTTDITGLHGIGSTAAASVPRVPLSQQPDGIACDGADGVNDGARLLVRALIPDCVDAATVALLMADWGYTNGAGSFATLPSSPKREGEYIALTATDQTALTNLGVHIPGQTYEIGSGWKILAAQIYKPPVEFDLSTPNNPTNQRVLALAVDVKLSGVAFCQSVTNTTLVRPPLVLVHGINSGPDKWTGSSPSWVQTYTQNYGFVCQTVDHSGGTLTSGAPCYGGNGDIHDSYTFVAAGVSNVTKTFRVGGYFGGKKIAIQKTDIVAHSYGGVLSRWYIEKAGTLPSKEFADRRDVRKLITIGTPHKGTPVCNIMCEAYRNELFFNADVRSGYYLSQVGPFLNAVNSGSGLVGGLAGVIIRWHQGGTPPSTNQDDRIVPALQVLSVGSEVLNELNTTPFHDDVAYGSIVGTDDGMFTPINFNGFRFIEPTYDSWGSNTKSYFPWLSGLDGQANVSDAIVPVWSQELPARSSPFTETHLSGPDSANVRQQVRTWLNDATLPRGAAHRSPFTSAPGSGVDAISRANAYNGSVMGSTSTTSLYAGVVQDAIVQVKYSKAHTNADLNLSVTPPVLGTKGGIVKVTCTGMVNGGGRHVTIVSDDLWPNPDDTLHDNIAVSYSGSGELQTFTVEGRIGRTVDADILGPDGQDNNLFGIGGATWDVGYKMSGTTYTDWSVMQSPPRKIKCPKYQLSPPSGTSPVPTAPGNPYTCEGGTPTTGTPGSIQAVRLQVFDYDVLSGNELLYDDFVYPTVPAVSFANALIPYSGTVFLFKDSAGKVAGVDGSSGDISADIFQKLPDIGKTSGNVTITVTP
jgi:triacylglycerol esterase/lipase EstA (alpha/beta hydrolase family)